MNICANFRSLVGPLVLSCAYARVLRAFALVGPSGLEPPTSCLSGTRSNLLSYDPMWLVWFSIHTRFLQSREQISLLSSLCWHWAIFPCRFQQSIFATAELNFCVRNGNRWTLCVITPTISVSLLTEYWTTLIYDSLVKVSQTFP